MGQLIDDLLAFSRIGQAEMQKTEVNLDRLVQEALRDFQGGDEGAEALSGTSTRCRRCGPTGPCCAWCWSI